MSQHDAYLQPVLDGLREFIMRTVLPLEDAHGDLLGDPKRCYDDRGARAAETQDLCREVRVAAAEAGYYTMFAPEQVGGAGLGAAALYAVWETIGRTAGGGRLLPYETVGHWTSGPSFLLSELRPATRAKVAEDVMAGRETTCFGMSEPDAGSDAWSMRTRAERDGERGGRPGFAADHRYLRPDGIKDTRRANDRIAAYRDALPERFPAAVGIVEPLYGERGLDEIVRCKEALGLVGLSFHTRFQGVSADNIWVRRRRYTV